MKINKLIIIISCLIGLIAASVYSSKIRHLRDEMIRSSERVSVLTVTRNLRAGETLTSQDLQESLFLKEEISARAISPVDIEIIAGRRLIHPVPAHDPILWTDFPEGPRLRHPSERIPAGYRVIALPADEIHTLVHFIVPGDTVDIISSNFEVKGDRLVTRPIAEKVTILSVGRLMEGQPRGDSTEEYPLSVSIAVDPDTALKILHASQVGEVHFLARGSSPFTQLSSHMKQNMSSGNPQGERP